MVIGPLVVSSDTVAALPDLLSYFEWRLFSVTSNAALIGISEANHTSTTTVAGRALSLFRQLASTASSNRQVDIHRVVLTHLDPEPRNWMVLDDGTVTGLIDWEFHANLPAVFAIDYPYWIRYDANLDPLFADTEPKQEGEAMSPLCHYWEEAPEVALHLRKVYFEVGPFEGGLYFFITNQNLQATKSIDQEYSVMLESCAKLRGLHSWLLGNERDIGLRRLGKWMDAQNM